MNKEYVNEDELAKSMVVSMYRKQNELCMAKQMSLSQA